MFKKNQLRKSRKRLVLQFTTKNVFISAFFLMILLSGAFSENKIKLSDAINNALITNEALLKIKNHLDVIELKYNENYRKYFPDLTLKYEQQRQNNYQTEDVDYKSAYVELSYIIKTSGELFLSRDVEKIDILLTKIEFDMTSNNIVIDIKKSFYGIISKLREIEIYNDLMKNMMAQKEIMLTERKLGMITDLDVLQVESKILENQYSIIKARNELSDLLTDFKKRSGLNFKDIPQFEMKIPAQDTLISNYKQIKNDTNAYNSVDKNYEIMKNNYDVVKVRYSLILTKRAYYPDIKLFTSYGYAGDRFPLNEKRWGVGVTVSLNAFGNSTSYTDEYKEENNSNTKSRNQSGEIGVLTDPNYASTQMSAESEYMLALKSSALLREQIIYQITRQFQSVDETIKMISVADEDLKMITKQITIEELRRKTGEITYLDLFNIYIDQSKARLRLMESHFTMINQIASLEFMIGRMVNREY